MLNKLLIFYSLFYGSLIIGATLKKWQKFSGLIMRYTILFIETPIFLYSFWILDLSQLRLFLPLPVSSIILVILTTILAIKIAPKIYTDKKSQGSIILTATFSNVGITGGVSICYLLFGLPGLSLASIFLLPIPILIFTLGFSLAKHYACDCRLNWRDYLMNIGGNIISLLPLSAMLLGLMLNLLNIPTPEKLKFLVDAGIKIHIALMCLAIGMSLQVPKIRKYWKTLSMLAAIKFLLSPLMALIIVLIIYHSLTSLPAKVILIQAIMPPAIYAVITSSIFELDKELANNSWFLLSLLLIPISLVLFLLH